MAMSDNILLTNNIRKHTLSKINKHISKEDLTMELEDFRYPK